MTRIIVLLAPLLASTYAWAAEPESFDTPRIPRPGYLEPIVDPVFGTTIIRITDAGRPIANPTNDPSLDGRSWGYQTGHAYSSRAAWNADQSLIVMEKGVDGMIFLDGADYKPHFRRGYIGTTRWHPTDPDVMLYVDRNNHCLGAYEPRTDTKLWNTCFGGYNDFNWGDPGTGKPSVEGNIIPVRAQRISDDHWVAFLFYADSDTWSEEIDMSLFVDQGDEPHFIMSPLGDTIIIEGCIVGHTERCEAQVAVDVATRMELWRTSNYHDPGHADEAVDIHGQQWRIGVSKEGTYAGHIIKRNFRTGAVVSLIPYWGDHTSTRGIMAARDMAIVTYVEPTNSPLQDEIVGVCLDGSCLERYAHVHRADSGDYLAESHGSVSQFGDKIVFRSNWDNYYGPIDAYVIELGGAPLTPSPSNSTSLNNSDPDSNTDSGSTLTLFDLLGQQSNADSELDSGSTATRFNFLQQRSNAEEETDSGSETTDEGKWRCLISSLCD